MSLSTLSEYKSRYQIEYFSRGVLADNLKLLNRGIQLIILEAF